jgi:hypothetical protein
MVTENDLPEWVVPVGPRIPSQKEIAVRQGDLSGRVRRSAMRLLHCLAGAFRFPRVSPHPPFGHLLPKGEGHSEPSP